MTNKNPNPNNVLVLSREGEEAIGVLDLNLLPQMTRNDLNILGHKLKCKSINVGGKDLAISKIQVQYWKWMHQQNNQEVIDQGVEPVREDLNISFPDTDDAIQENAENTSDEIKPVIPETFREATPEEIMDIKLNNLRALRRVKINNLDPRKASVPGEVIAVHTGGIGTITKFIPFDSDFYANGYHVPQAILNVLAEKEYQHITTTEEISKGLMNIVPKAVSKKEYEITYMTPLTQEEIDVMKRKQEAAETAGLND